MMNRQMFTPDYSHITGLLQQLNDEELKELLNNEEKLKAIVSDLKQVQDIEAEREMLMASNKSISEYNLSRKPILEQHRKQVTDTRTIALDLKNSFLEKKQKIEKSSTAVSQDTLLALLQAATSEVEEEAEAAVDFFLKNEMPIENFLEKYLELRKTAHLRRIKAEKLTSILRGDVNSNPMPPVKPNRLRTPPPPPPVPKQEFPYPTPRTAAQSGFSYGPVRTAPLPPANNIPYPPNMYVQNQARPAQPFTYNPTPYAGGYYMPQYPTQQYPNYK